MQKAKATAGDLAKRPAAVNISAEEAVFLPKGSLFCDKMGRWFVTTRLSPNEIIEHLASICWRFSKKKQALQGLVGAENVLSIRFKGHKKVAWVTERDLGEVPKLPTKMGSYYTYGGGWGTEFSSYTVKEGESFEHQGNTWFCVYENYERGDARNFSTVGVLAVRL